MHVCLRNDGALVGDFQGAHHGFAQIGVGQALNKAIAAYRAATGGAAGFFREGRAERLAQLQVQRPAASPPEETAVESFWYTRESLLNL